MDDFLILYSSHCRGNILQRISYVIYDMVNYSLFNICHYGNYYGAECKPMDK